MPTQVQFRRGTSAQNDTFTGASGELSVDTDNKTIRIHDGSTIGGFAVAKRDLSNISNVGVITATRAVVGTNVVMNSTGITVTGIVTATDFNSTSDETLKKNIQVIENPIEKVLQLNGVTFNWKDNDEASVGVIAQEVEKVFPELVHGLEPKTVSYNGLVGLLIECIKHQQRQINELKEHMIGS